MTPEWITARAAAERLEVSKKRVFDFLREGRLQGELNQAEGRWHIFAASVDALAHEREAGRAGKGAGSIRREAANPEPGRTDKGAGRAGTGSGDPNISRLLDLLTERDSKIERLSGENVNLREQLSAVKNRLLMLEPGPEGRDGPIQGEPARPGEHEPDTGKAQAELQELKAQNRELSQDNERRRRFGIFADLAKRFGF
jgi:hypothetical protein